MNRYGGSIYRTTPLPSGDLQSRFVLNAGVIADTQSALLRFYKAGALDGGHEGICYWAGTEEGGLTTFQTVLVPNADHGPGSVFVSAAEYGKIARDARRRELGILAQVHSHPGDDTRHSDGDDRLIIMPFEGMLSIVAPRYGRGLQSIDDCSVHQYQQRAWVLCSVSSCRANIAGDRTA